LNETIKNILERFESENNVGINVDNVDKSKSLKENNFYTHLLRAILSNENCKYEEIGEDHKNQIETITDNIMALVSNLLNVLGKEVEIKRAIEDGIDNKLGKYKN